jgi:hypothetical protein
MWWPGLVDDCRNRLAAARFTRTIIGAACAAGVNVVHRFLRMVDWLSTSETDARALPEFACASDRQLLFRRSPAPWKP